MREDPPTRVTWEIEPSGANCKLTVTHDGFEAETPTFHSVGEGWPEVLSSLKSLIETGEALARTATANETDELKEKTA